MQNNKWNVEFLTKRKWMFKFKASFSKLKNKVMPDLRNTVNSFMTQS